MLLEQDCNINLKLLKYKTLINDDKNNSTNGKIKLKLI